MELTGIVDRPDPDDGGADGCPVAVFSHCFTCNKDLKATVRISRALAKLGVAVLRFDMMGLGGSGGNFSESNFTTNLADLAAAIRFADQELGPVTALLGHSFGGIASLVTASHATDADAAPLQKLGFVATLAAPSDTRHLATLLARMSPQIESDGVGTVTIGGITWKIRRQMLEDFRKHDVTKSMAQVTCPVLLLHSPVDETVGYEHALRLMSLIQTPPGDPAEPVRPVSLVTLADADHLLAKNSRDLQFVSRLLAIWCHRHH
ncbi:alpha/beta fold hydrolase [Roseiconus nitratireducens]|uniref:Palmitoyl-protein thioesterase ABHD10, mitochondrial n=2 Tax=Roseiconus nitratireducens TaxID=2605748 RepID=A0A5M6DIN6_9BACT|nr:alpha/beta fold hydrolase [Roseiconus nitratireducens]